VNDVDHGVLTTFAGLLLRDLLDRFNGDVSLAVAAYNGGPGNPSRRYEEVFVLWRLTSGVLSTRCNAERRIDHAKILD